MKKRLHIVKCALTVNQLLMPMNKKDTYQTIKNYTDVLKKRQSLIYFVVIFIMTGKLLFDSVVI